ncbi:MAG: response regulator, partial [Haloferacaceae archaeon]
EDNPGDVKLTEKAFENARLSNDLHVVNDGVEALDFLHRRGEYEDAPRPDLILLDLNLPRKPGEEVLEEVKADEALKRLPVVILTSSEAEEDILQTYDLHANAYLTKPVSFDGFTEVIQKIEGFWFSVVKYPPE